MTLLPRRLLWLPCAMLVLTAPLVLGQATDPAEARTRAILDSKLTFKTYVFTGEQFPACSFENQAKAEELLGAFALKVAYYDHNKQPVESAKTPGVYGAVIEVTPKMGPPLRRFVTLYRTPGAVAADLRFTPETAADFARATGIESAVVKQESKLIAEQAKQRSFSECSTDPRIARLLAGLSLAKAGDGPARKNADAFVLERQFWVDLKRKREGLDKVYTKPLVAPRPIEGKPARVVREGTLAEAGMKPDAATKIDAVLQDWAANDDQAFAVCIVRHGVIVLHKAYGTRDGQPMTLQTKSWMASITKTMSASLMWMLIDQGIVSLDDPIDKFLPPVRGIKVARPLTIRHLYTHTNGLNKWPGWHDELPDVEDRLVSYYPQLVVAKEFGYNGTGYILGGKIIENITGEAIPRCFQRHLLDPLGCPNTDVLGTHADAQSVPLDIAKFGQMLLNKGAYGQWRFFSEETFEKMLPQPLTPIIGPDAKRTFGIGLDGKPEKFGHGAASAATFSVDCTEDLVVIMTRNKFGKVQDKYNGKFWDAIKAGIEREKKD